LLIRGNSLLVLDLGLDIVNRIGGLDLKSDGLARKGLDEAIVLSVSNLQISRFCSWWRGVVLGGLHLHYKKGRVSKSTMQTINKSTGGLGLLIASSTSLSWCR